eukprot:SAG11_NODE_26991_length_338_cov_1.075314_1_plen_78_part_10
MEPRVPASAPITKIIWAELGRRAAAAHAPGPPAPHVPQVLAGTLAAATMGDAQDALQAMQQFYQACGILGMEKQKMLA